MPVTSWWRRLWDRQCDPGPSVDMPDMRDAQRAASQASQAQAEADDLRREYRRLGERLRSVRQENHFADDIARALRGPG